MKNPIRSHTQCTANRARASAAGTSRCRVDARELQPLHAQNFPSRAPQVNDAIAAATVLNGGSARVLPGIPLPLNVMLSIDVVRGQPRTSPVRATGRSRRPKCLSIFQHAAGRPREPCIGRGPASRALAGRLTPGAGRGQVGRRLARDRGGAAEHDVGEDPRRGCGGRAMAYQPGGAAAAYAWLQHRVRNPPGFGRFPAPGQVSQPAGAGSASMSTRRPCPAS